MRFLPKGWAVAADAETHQGARRVIAGHYCGLSARGIRTPIEAAARFIGRETQY